MCVDMQHYILKVEHINRCLPQVNQLLQVAQKCQGSTEESGPDGISSQDLQANSVMWVTFFSFLQLFTSTEDFILISRRGNIICWCIWALHNSMMPGLWYSYVSKCRFFYFLKCKIRDMAKKNPNFRHEYVSTSFKL